jgi:hypothetical protein
LGYYEGTLKFFGAVISAVLEELGCSSCPDTRSAKSKFRSIMGPLVLIHNPLPQVPAAGKEVVIHVMVLQILIENDKESYEWQISEI